MARRRGLDSLLIAAVRQAQVEHRRVVAANERQVRAHAREIEHLEREAGKITEKLAKGNYLEKRINEAADLTNDSISQVEYLKSGILPETLKIKNILNFDTLKPKFEPPIFAIPKQLTKEPTKPREETYISAVKEMPFLGKVFSSTKQKWLNEIENAKITFRQDLKIYQDRIEEQKADTEKLKIDFDNQKKVYEEGYKLKCQEIDEFKAQYLTLDIDAVISYVSLVLERSDYSIDWDREYKIAYSPDSKELLIEYRLPNCDIVPLIAEYKYVKSKDEIEERPRKKAEIDNSYKALISNIALRTLHEVIESDQASAILTVCFNGYIIALNAANGQMVSPTIISISVLKSEFESIILDKVDVLQCIKGLSASVSSSPSELVAVKPIREYSMVDRRFVQEEDIASTMDSRPNLMDLDPFEFENLVSNLFTKMGLETKQTRSSKDGGVDAIAFDTRPILGGKIVIQAKRYKNTVGVSAVRDLYGTMINEGASKGILVTTSSYGPDAFHFSKDKPIELIDGGGLLYLLNQAGIKAKIILPE
jgi:restriction system protein